MKTELKIPNAVGFCKNCFRSRRDGSAYCGECKDEGPRMKVYLSTERFPLTHKVVKKFGLKDITNIIFTYGDTIYKSPLSNYGMPAHLLAHELTHVFQQTKMGKDKWWDKYLKDDKFRLEQETQAYQQQYKVAKEIDALSGEMILRKLCEDLSGEMYGNIVNFTTAEDLIKGNQVYLVENEMAKLR